MDINEWNYLHLISYDEVAKSQQMTAFLYVLMLSCGFLMFHYDGSRNRTQDHQAF